MCCFFLIVTVPASKDDVKTRFQDCSDNSYSSQPTSPSTTQINNTKISATSGSLNHTNLYFPFFKRLPLFLVLPTSSSTSLLLGFTHVIRLALGGQAKSEHGYRIELITYHSY